MKVLSRAFYLKDPALAAKNLIGKVLVRRLADEVLRGRMVETEAYYGENDPASRAYNGVKKFNKPMWEDAGRAFIYMVHANWLLNIVAHPENEVGAVLIRAVEPLEGIEEMKKHRKAGNIIKLTSGPGKLTRAMRITRELNRVDLTNSRSEIFICDSECESDTNLKILSSHRIGVKRDLARELRFYIEGNPFVSR